MSTDASGHDSMHMMCCGPQHFMWSGTFYVVGGLVALGYYMGSISLQAAIGLVGVGLLVKGLWKLSLSAH